MTSISLSTASLYGALRIPAQRTQTELTKASQEASTGRHADVGLTLGSQTGTAAALRQMRARLDTLTQTNGMATARLSQTQTSLDTVRTSLESLQKTVVSATAGTATVDSLAQAASAAFSTATGAFNTNVGGQYLFAGINTDVKPFADDGASGVAAINAAFTASFGMAPGDPAAASISPAAMQAFLNGPFTALFASPSWESNWSSASSTEITSRISPSQVSSTSASANDSAARASVKAVTMLSQLGLSSLSAATRSTVLSAASSAIGEASKGVTSLQARIGQTQNLVTGANDAMAHQSTFIDTQIGGLENVDPAEVSTRISALTTQLETAYSLTAKISQLSLVNYLR